MSNQRSKNVVYGNVEIYNVGERRINVPYFNVGINNVRQCRNNVVIFNFEFHNVDERRNNVVNMIIFKKLKKEKKYFWATKKRWLIWLTTLAFRCDRLKRKGNMSSNVNEVIRAVLNSLFFLRKDFARTKSIKSTKITKSTKTQPGKSTKRYKRTVRAWWSHHTNNSTSIHMNKN